MKAQTANNNQKSRLAVSDFFSDTFIHTLQFTGESNNMNYEAISAITGTGYYDGKFYKKVNLNEVVGHPITSLAEFSTVEADMKKKLSVGSDSKRVRIDICLNTDTDYQNPRYYKINKYLLTLYAISIGATNNFEVTDLITNKPRSMNVRDPRKCEIVVYDKNEESKGKSPYKTRLEIRLFNYDGIKSIRDRLLAFCRELDGIIATIPKMNQIKVAALEDEYERYRTGKHHKGVVSGFKEFVYSHRDEIFNREILKTLDSKYSGCADVQHWLQKYSNMLLITDQEIIGYIKAIKRSIKEYINMPHIHDKDVLAKSASETCTFCQNDPSLKHGNQF